MQRSGCCILGHWVAAAAAVRVATNPLRKWKPFLGNLFADGVCRLLALLDIISHPGFWDSWPFWVILIFIYASVFMRWIYRAVHMDFVTRIKIWWTDLRLLARVLLLREGGCQRQTGFSTDLGESAKKKSLFFLLSKERKEMNTGIFRPDPPPPPPMKKWNMFHFFIIILHLLLREAQS